MILGDLQLPVVAVSGLTQSDSWTYAAHAVIEGPTRRQFVARDATPVTLSVYLHAEYCFPDQVYAQLRTVADAHEVLTLQTDVGVIIGDFVIEGLDQRPIWTLPNGSTIAMTVDIKLVDPGVEVGIVPPEPVAVEGTKADTTSTPKAEDTTTPMDDVTPTQIARL